MRINLRPLLHLTKGTAKSYEFQNWMFNVNESTCFWGRFFSVSRYETKKKVTILDQQKTNGSVAFPKIRLFYEITIIHNILPFFSETLGK